MKRSVFKTRAARSISWLLIVSLLCGLIPPMTLPAFSAEQSVWVELDGERITAAALPEDAKLRFRAVCAEGAQSYQWEIRQREPDRWIRIADGASQYLFVTRALVSSMLDEANCAYLRCAVVTEGGEKCLTDPVKVSLSLTVPETEGALPFSELPLRRASARATESEFTTYSIVINYLFDDNTIAFEPYGATVAAGSSFRPEPIESHKILGYEPFRRVGNEYVPAETVIFDIESVTEDIVVNVIYEPALVKFAVHHYLQNVQDDGYTLSDDRITYEQALTGSTVGDGLALSEEELPGFQALSYEHLTVAADGSTVIEIRYDRNYYLVDFDMAGGYGTEPIYTRYGATVGANDPTRHGYVFDGWELISYGGNPPTAAQQSAFALSSGKTVSVPAASLRYRARWITQETTYTMVFWRENAEDNDYTYWGYLDGLPAMSGSLVSGQDYISRVSGIEDEAFFTFNESKTEKNKIVEGDGSTVVNVYYTRNYYTLTFKAAGLCTLAEDHTHTEDCYDQICGLGHVHDETCVATLICTTPEHTSHTADCILCGKTEHIHGSADCNCTVDEHVHTSSCYRNVGSVQTGLVNAPKNPEDGQIYRSSYRYYIHISGIWYAYNGWGVSSGDVVDPTCGKTAHTHGTDCDCAIEAHVHEDSCYRDSLHSHGEGCYLYSCGDISHSHTAACNRLICPKPAGHSHSSTCKNASRTNTVKTVYAKYGQSLRDLWPVTDGNGVTYSSGERWSPSDTDLYDYVLVYIDQMPGDDFTLTVDRSSNSTYTMNYYLQVLPGEAAGDDDVIVSYGGNTYKRYQQIKANYGRVTRAEDFFEIPGFDPYASSPAFSGDSITISGSNKVVDFYYNRSVHTISFHNNGTVLADRTAEGVMYGESVAPFEFTPPYPENLEPNAYTFGGWYTSPGCFAGTEADFETLTMPDGDLLLYAKWTPITHTVRVFKDKDKTVPLGPDQIVSHGDFATAPAGNVTNGNYVFLGWFYEEEENGKTVEKAFVFNGIPVLDDMDIYARWGSHFSVDYTIYYRLKDTDVDVAEPTVGRAVVGNNKTFYAKTENDLYEGYRTGFYPHTESHTITMSAEGDHVFIFEYTFVASMPYKVRYLDQETLQPLFPEKVVEENTLSVVTETFLTKDRMMPDAYQKRLVLSSDPTDEDGDGFADANVITFYYRYDEVHAFYRVVHSIQNMTGNAYREFRSEEFVGLIGESLTVSALTLTGFTYESSLTTLNGVPVPDAGPTVSTTLTEEGALIEFFYNRESYPYLVRYLDLEGREVESTKTAQASFGLQVIEYAPDLSAKGYVLASEGVKTHTVSANVEMNVIEFYYQEKTVTLKYQIVGPEDCGSLTQGSENVSAISGTAVGSSPMVKNGFLFLGWYRDEACTVPVEASWVDENHLLTPQKEGAIWTGGTFYASFGAMKTDLTITTTGAVSWDEGQIFLFRIKGKADTDTAAVDLRVTVVGNGSVTVTELPVGEYEICEETAWSWRYENDEAARALTLSYSSEGTTLVFDNRRESGKWLDGNAHRDNRF